jgi:NTP pyrophosphatase (non-canonical NTP hydrolase)
MSYPRDLDDIAHDAHAYATERGFWQGRNIETGAIPVLMGLAKLMLITTEVAEAAEVLRAPTFVYSELAEELADILIRTLDLAEAYDIHIGQAVSAKMYNNRKRDFMHGKLA